MPELDRPDMLDAALSYYDRGWMPIPLRSAGSPDDLKRPALDRWRQYQHIRPERHEIGRWWSDTYPSANIGLVCGRVSGLVVVDFDGAVADPVSFLDENGLPSSCPIAQTGGGGFHCYFSHPGGNVENGVRVGEIEGVKIDIRGDGGYVVAPPSRHGSGRRYVWVQEGEVGRPAPIFPDIYRRLRQDAPAPTSTRELIDTAASDLFAPAPQGQRNHAAARLAGYLLKVTREDADAAWHLLRLWNERNLPPLDERELQHTFTSVVRTRQRDPNTEHAEDGTVASVLPVLSGEQWAEKVRHIPPRAGVQAPSLPTLSEVGGLVPGDLVLLAGRPGMGKSTAAWGVAVDVAIKQRVPTLLLSTEMTAVDVARWIGAKLHGVPAKHLTPSQWDDTLRQIARSPLSICDRGLVSVTQISALLEQHPETRLLIVDHIQRVQGGGTENRNQQLEQIAAKLKGLAKDTPCAVLALSQMNRASVLDRTSRPELTSLRDSGGLEQEADAVIFLWSDAPDLTEVRLPVKFYLCKNRHGQSVELPALFDKPRKCFLPIDATQAILQHHAQIDLQRRATQIAEES